MKIVWYNAKKSFLEKNCMTELKIRYNRSNKAGLVENYYISKYQIYPQVDHSYVGDSEYCLIKK